MKQRNTTKARDKVTSAWRGWAMYLLGLTAVVIVTVAVYWPSMHGAFVMDDMDCIIGNPGVRSLEPSHFFTGDLRVRPVAYFTFAVSYALSDGRNPFRDSIQFHVFNLAVHILAAMLLCGIVRRTLLGENGDWLGFRGVAVASDAKPVPVPIFPPLAATSLALCIAMLWAVHPLNTGAVSYVIQREESLMGMFFLLALYAVIRGHSSRSPVMWHAVAVIACVLGAGTKQVIAVAPLVIAIYDRVFLGSSWRDVLRRRGAAYAGMIIGIGGMLAMSFAGMRGNPTVGFGSELVPTSLDYALTQPGVILRYLSLSFRPAGQVLDYMWPVSHGWEQIVPQTAAIMAMLAATVVALRRRPAWGFLGAWFFLILGPSSSFMPIKDPIFEHRMYLPLAAVVAGVVIAAYVLARRIGDWLGFRGVAVASAAKPAWPGVADVGRSRVPVPNSPRRWPAWVFGTVLGLGAVAALAVAAGERNQTYQTPVSVWRDVTSKRPDNYRAFNNLGQVLHEQAQSLPRGDDRVPVMLDEAFNAFSRSVQLKPDHATALNNLGSMLKDRGQYAQAEDCLLRSITAGQERQRQFGTPFPNPHINYAMLLTEQGRWAAAETQWRIVCDQLPDNVPFRYNLGLAIKEQGRYKDALDIFEPLYKVTQSADILNSIIQCREKLSAN